VVHGGTHPSIHAPGLMQEDHEFEASFSYIARPCLKMKEDKKRFISIS
jgi:hypothetical protein